MALLVIVGAIYLDADGESFPAANLHLTQAEWQVTDARGFTTPSATLDSHSLPNAWRHVALPLDLPIALLRQAHANAITTAGQTTWLRLAVPHCPRIPARWRCMAFASRLTAPSRCMSTASWCTGAAAGALVEQYPDPAVGGAGAACGRRAGA